MASRPTEVTTVCVNPTIDVSLEIDRLVSEHKMLASSSRRDPGGGGVNVARSVQRLGGMCSAVITSGGVLGTELERHLTNERVEALAVRIDEDTRESVTIRDCENEYRIVLPGPQLSNDELTAVESMIMSSSGEIVVLSGRLNPGIEVGWYRRMQEALAPRRVVVDCAQPALSEVVQGPATLLKPSLRELESLVDATLESDEEIVDAATEVLQRGSVEALLISRAARGAVLVTKREAPLWYKTPEIAEVSSTVGCGDAMVAGIVHFLRTGRTMAQAARFGIAAGSAAALTPGTSLFAPEDAFHLFESTPPPTTRP